MSEDVLLRSKAEWLMQHGYFPEKSYSEIVEMLREKSRSCINKDAGRESANSTCSNTE